MAYSPYLCIKNIHEENSIIYSNSINNRLSKVQLHKNNKKKYEKVLFVLTSHDKLGDTGENRILD
jgi:hypothetical protein